MKISVSLSAEDVEFLTEYARRNGRSRSGAVHDAIAALRDETLASAYEQAWSERETDGVWEQALADGLWP